MAVNERERERRERERERERSTRSTAVSEWSLTTPYREVVW